MPPLTESSKLPPAESLARSSLGSKVTVLKAVRSCGRYLEQQLVLCDPLDGFDEEVADGQPGLDVLLDSLQEQEDKELRIDTS